MSLVMSMQFLCHAVTEMILHVHHIFAPKGNDVISLEISK